MILTLHAPQIFVLLFMVAQIVGSCVDIETRWPRPVGAAADVALLLFLLWWGGFFS